MVTAVVDGKAHPAQSIRRLSSIVQQVLLLLSSTMPQSSNGDAAPPGNRRGVHDPACERRPSAVRVQGSKCSRSTHTHRSATAQLSAAVLIRRVLDDNPSKAGRRPSSSLDADYRPRRSCGASLRGANAVSTLDNTIST